MIEMSGKTKRVTAVGAALFMCLLVGWQARALPDPAGSERFHSAVRSEAEKVPVRVGPWVSRELPITPAAVQLLRPNVLHQRRWTDTRSNESVTVLVVHCGDTRDLLGHYPPVCYVGQGWQLTGMTDWDAEMAGTSYKVPEYEFMAVKGAQTEGLWVRNAMLLPGAGLGRDMDDVKKAARNVTRRFFGAGQVQFVFPHEYREDQRERITKEMLGIYGDVLRAVSGSVELGSDPTSATKVGGSVTGEGEKREVP